MHIYILFVIILAIIRTVSSPPRQEPATHSLSRRIAASASASKAPAPNSHTRSSQSPIRLLHNRSGEDPSHSNNRVLEEKGAGRWT
jgi:hypothetical protein